MSRFALLAVILLSGQLVVACASVFESGGGKVHREVAAVVQDEAQRDKVIDAAQKGATPAQALDKAAAGPTHEKVPG